MNGVALIMRALHRGERRLAEQLEAVAARHRAEHEIHHVATDLARWSDEHCLRIAGEGVRHGLGLDGPAPDAADAGGTGAADAADHPDAGLLLLHDLWELHLVAAGNSLYWEMLTQAARAGHDDELGRLAAACHPRTLRQMRWTTTMLKNLSPQTLTVACDGSA
ncbi:hypothetical protein ACIO87_09335 [Streptomyces sp. NPDC087218]|uniref:hypothetical protein n=1 Tax=Streptomyces sp. NPDC087218 TaxID=3365769 RepID=UPI00382BFA6C